GHGLAQEADRHAECHGTAHAVGEGAIASDEAAGGVDQCCDHPAMGHAAAVQMLGLEFEGDLGMVLFPFRQPIAHELGESARGFGPVLDGEGTLREGSEAVYRVALDSRLASY